MAKFKIYSIRIPSFGNYKDTVYEIPVVRCNDIQEKTIGYNEINRFKEYLRKLHHDWQDALILKYKTPNNGMRYPIVGDILKISGHSGITDVGVIDKIYYIRK